MKLDDNDIAMAILPLLVIPAVILGVSLIGLALAIGEAIILCLP